MIERFRHIVAGLVLVVVATGAMAQSEAYRVRAGDTLVIEVLEDPALNRAVVVLPDGRFSFPFAGAVRAAGRSVGQIEAALGAAIASNFAAKPNVFVGVQPAERKPAAAVVPKTIDVYFLGEVNTPGLKETAEGTTFLQALAQSGGLTRFAAAKRIQLRRTDPVTRAQTVLQIDYKALMNGAALTNDVPLQDGDVILVPERRLFE